MSGKEVLQLLLDKAKEHDREQPVEMTCEGIEDFYLGVEDLLSALMKMVADKNAGIIEDLPDGVKEVYY